MLYRVFASDDGATWDKVGETAETTYQFTSALSNAKGITFSYKGVKVMKVTAAGLTKKIKVTVKITNKFAKQKLKYVKVKVGSKTYKFKLNKKGVVVRRIKVNKKGNV